MSLCKRWHGGLVWVGLWVASCLASAAAPHHALSPDKLPPVELALQAATTLDQACVLPGSASPPGPGEAWRHVPLPHVWGSTHPAYDGAMWYRFRVSLAHPPDTLWAVYLPRAVMNAQVWVNGVPMAYTGSMSPPVARNWYVPLLVQVPEGVWHAGENVIHVKVVSGYMSRDGLAPIQLGPLDLLEPAYKSRSLWQVDGATFANIALLALGVFMVIVWWRDREQGAIGFQGASAVLWGIGSTANLASRPLFNHVLWTHLAFTAMMWSALAMSLFFRRFVGLRSRRVEGLILALFFLAPLCATLSDSADLNALAFCPVFLVFLVSLFQAVLGVVRQRRRDRHWLLAGCALLVPAAVHDLAFQCDWLPFDTIYLVPFVSPFMMGCIFYMLAGDYARSRRALNRLNGSLAEMLAERELALRESFKRLADLERAQAVSAERSRILRDMHDGVGAHLTSALRQLQSPRPQGVDLGLVTQTLRDSLDQLKLSIDALSLAPGDVVGLLASLRFRVTPRLKAVGLDLVWDVDDLPLWPPGHAPALRQLQYILFEGLSNVLQHSGASRLTLSARALDDGLRLSLVDNGRGWVGSGEGQGLQAMRARASVIGAHIAFLAAPSGGFELRITLPMSVPSSSSLSSAA